MKKRLKRKVDKNKEFLKTRRNTNIKKKIVLLREAGFKVKDTFKIVGAIFYLSPERVRDVWYDKK